MKRQILIIDTSAILSGKPINFPDSEMITTPSVSEELSPGGRDYRNFEFLKEKGLIIQSPSKESILKIKKIAEETGDINRLSNADIELLALALDKIMMKNRDVCILTDDYSIQNIANNLNIDYKNISQRGITKNFKWYCRCPGCGKQFKASIKICPICGTETKIAIGQKHSIK
jgi:UPF0271 protein